MSFIITPSVCMGCHKVYDWYCDRGKKSLTEGEVRIIGRENSIPERALFDGFFIHDNPSTDRRVSIASSGYCPDCGKLIKRALHNEIYAKVEHEKVCIYCNRKNATHNGISHAFQALTHTQLIARFESIIK